MRKDHLGLDLGIRPERVVPNRQEDSSQLVQEHLKVFMDMSNNIFLVTFFLKKKHKNSIVFLPGIPELDTGIRTVFRSSVRLTHWLTKLCSRSTSLSVLSCFCIKRCNCWSRCCRLRATASLHLSRNRRRSSSWYESSCF